MIRHLIICCLLILIGVSSIAFAQNFSTNPFKNVAFINTPTDTITLIALYKGVVDSIDYKSQSITSSIKKNTGKGIKNLKYSVELTLPGYPSKLMVPCTDIGMFNALKGLAQNTPLSIKCMVYRFYSFDGICNFFYVDNIHTTQIAKSNLADNLKEKY